jgi:NADH:ubiquinone reductase (H+-translocating)
MFEEYDDNHDGTLSPAEFGELLRRVDAKLTALPATAQVASQQGVYLAKLLGAVAGAAVPLADAAVAAHPPFAYHHMGSMAYIGGNKAVVEFTDKFWSGGLGAFFLWRSAYLSRQVSTSTRVNLALEWAKRPIVGHNMSRY